MSPTRQPYARRQPETVPYDPNWALWAFNFYARHRGIPDDQLDFARELFTQGVHAAMDMVAERVIVGRADAVRNALR